MRKKEVKYVVAFHTTADAMAMEKACNERGVEGRLIPVPRQISAGCGIAWCSPMEVKEKLPEVLKELNIEAEDMAECAI